MGKSWQKSALALPRARFLVEWEGDLLQGARLLDVGLERLNFWAPGLIPPDVSLSFSLHFKRFHLDLEGPVVPGTNSATYTLEIEEEERGEVASFLGAYVERMGLEELREAMKNEIIPQGEGCGSSAPNGLDLLGQVSSYFGKLGARNLGEQTGNYLLEEALALFLARGGGIFLAVGEGSGIQTLASRDLGDGGQEVGKKIVRESRAQRKGEIKGWPFSNGEGKTIGALVLVNPREGREENILGFLMALSALFWDTPSPVSKPPPGRALALVGKSRHVGYLRASLKKFRNKLTPLLLVGPEGTGKTLWARILHQEGSVGDGEFFPIDCKDSHWKEGVGNLGERRGGSLFLKNIHVLSPNERGELETLLEGVSHHRILVSSVEPIQWHFPEAETLVFWPLRRRTKDIPLLLEYFLEGECAKNHLPKKSFSPQLLEFLVGQDWPGNVRELKDCVVRALERYPEEGVLRERTGLVDYPSPPSLGDSRLPLKKRISLLEREIIGEEIRRKGGNKSRAARDLGISREALRRKLAA